MSHIGLKRGEAANRVVLMGEEVRAELVSRHLEGVKRIRSERGFLTFTGTYKSIPITVMSIGMGYPMMDLAVRELKEIVEGPMYFVRLGTCGLIQEPAEEHDLIRAVICDHGSAIVQRNYGCDFLSSEPQDFYQISEIWPADPKLTALIKAEAKGVALWSTLNITADSFYSSQGRPSPAGFLDHNETVLETVLGRFGGEAPCLTFEMETGHLFHLATAYSGKEEIRAAAVQLVSSRRSGPLTAEKAKGELESDAKRRDLEPVLGKIVIEALCKI